MTAGPLRTWAAETQRLVLDRPLRLESGATLPGVTIAWRSWGRLSARAENAVIVCHALTGSADADRWWAPLFGPGKALDPTRDFIVCSNVLGGCYGTTGPASLAPDGRRWGARFPALTIRDQVRAQMALADHLGIARIGLVVGGSMGGLQALEWALLDADRVAAVATLAASGRHSPWCAAWSEAQRQALFADPKYRGGDYPPDDPPLAGLAAARAMAMVSYRSPDSFARRFGRATGAQISGTHVHSPDELAVRGWLRHHGEALVRRFDAHSYRILIDAMDTHDLARGRGAYEDVLRGLRQPVLVGSINSDALYVPADQHQLVRLLPNAELLEIDSIHGHDGFLIDAAAFGQRLAVFRRRIAPHSAPAASDTAPRPAHGPCFRPLAATGSA
jgi:homoserine O-acetyltransferase